LDAVFFFSASFLAAFRCLCHETFLVLFIFNTIAHISVCCHYLFTQSAKRVKERSKVLSISGGKAQAGNSLLSRW
jgi:hypothetical protein